MFLRQDVSAELIIVDDGIDCIADIIPSTPQIRYIRLDPGHSIGHKRNVACSVSKGDVIVHWDDDDWYAPRRLSYQVKYLNQHHLDICGGDQLILADATLSKAWKYQHCPSITGIPWLCGSSLCYQKTLWAAIQFADTSYGEDVRFVRSAKAARQGALDDHRFMIARVHSQNSSRYSYSAAWPPYSIDAVRLILGDDWKLFLKAQRAPGKALSTRA